jgi:glucose/arabinose dehydrogenase
MQKMIKILILSIIASSALAAPKIEQVLKLDGVIWGFDFITPSTGIANLRSGEMYFFDLKTKKSHRIKGPEVKSGGQGGLLDIKYKRIGKVDYAYYTYSKLHKNSWTTALGRAQILNKQLVNHKDLFVARVVSDTSRHFGSRIVFKADKLFMTIGDRGERENSQKLSNHNGTIVRLNLDGSIPADNPFKGKRQRKEIWSYGHRNPQGIDIDPVSGEVFSCEFGPRGGDELNHVKKAKNYGWPVITYGREYWGPKIGGTKKEGMEQPIVHWTPSISPSGMAFYTGNKISKWKGNLFLANLSSQHLRRLVLKNNKVILQEELLKQQKERVRHVTTGLDGFLYISTDSGKLIKITAP